MGTDTSWGGEPIADWHPVQEIRNALSHFMP